MRVWGQSWNRLLCWLKGSEFRIVTTVTGKGGNFGQRCPASGVRGKRALGMSYVTVMISCHEGNAAQTRITRRYEFDGV
jgi:hypothetical protein